MIDKRVLVGLILLALIAAFLLFLTAKDSSTVVPWCNSADESIGALTTQVSMHYQDGSTDTIGTQWLYNQEKIIETFEYQVFGTCTQESPVVVDASQLYTELRMYAADGTLVGTKTSEPKAEYSDISVGTDVLLYSYEFDPYLFMEYGEYEDGTYSVVAAAKGTLATTSGTTNLPAAIEMDVTVEDERAVYISFGT